MVIPLHSIINVFFFKEFCQNKNLTLLTVKSTNEADWVYGNFRRELNVGSLTTNVGTFWLDASRDGGKFLWPDQTEVDPAKWQPGHPDEGADCVIMSRGKWFGVGCTRTYPFICKFNV